MTLSPGLLRNFELVFPSEKYQFLFYAYLYMRIVYARDTMFYLVTGIFFISPFYVRTKRQYGIVYYNIPVEIKNIKIAWACELTRIRLVVNGKSIVRTGKCFLGNNGE